MGRSKRKNSNWITEKKTPYWIILSGGIASVIAIAAGIIGLAGTFYDNYLQSHPKYAYETSFDWKTMDEAESMLSTKSKVTLFKDFESSWDSAYYNGAALIALYSNLDEQERVITKFSIYADDIVEDLSPNLQYFFRTVDMQPFTCCISNMGWGETGKIKITAASITPQDGSENTALVNLALREDACTSWEFETIKPGETMDLPLLSEQDFQITYWGTFDEPAYYNVEFTLEAPESDYTTTLVLPLEIRPDWIGIFSSGLGGAEAVNYVLWVDTSNPSWSATYDDIYQRLPAKQTVCIPMFIVPSKSCSMSVRIEFETLDGEVISASPLKNAKFIIPYYTDPNTYLDGNLLDWNTIEGTIHTNLLSSDGTEDVNIYFPYAGISKVVPPEALDSER